MLKYFEVRAQYSCYTVLETAGIKVGGSFRTLCATSRWKVNLQNFAVRTQHSCYMGLRFRQNRERPLEVECGTARFSVAYTELATSYHIQPIYDAVGRGDPSWRFIRFVVIFQKGFILIRVPDVIRGPQRTNPASMRIFLYKIVVAWNYFLEIKG